MERKVTIIRENTADIFLEEIQRKAHFYVPEWSPGVEGDFGNALFRIFADMAENIAVNLNETPRKHFFSFLDLLKFSLRPARAAKTVLCFVPESGAPENVIIPAKTCATAEGSKGEKIFFETEKTISATPAKLCFVCSSDRERDSIFDHSSTIGGTESSILLSGKNLQEHIFYIGDAELFRIGKGRISFTFTALGSTPARVLAEENLFSWEYAASDSGKKEKEREITEWVPFSTVGFSGGKLVIQKGEETIGKGKLNGLESRWIRCRLKHTRISELEQFSLGSVRADVSAEGITPDLLFCNDIPLEEEGEGILPFGSKPLLYDTFYIACSEVFSRQGCEVRMDFYLELGRTGSFSEKPVLSWEYWSGESWLSLKKFIQFSAKFEESEDGENESEEELLDLELENFLLNKIEETETENESYDITRFFPEEVIEIDADPVLVHVSAKIREMPSMMPGNVNGAENFWIRVRLIEGNFGKVCVISKKNVIKPGKFFPPKIRNPIFSYSDWKGREPEYLVSENNLTFENKEGSKLVEKFKPFEKIHECLPGVYFGFTSKLVKGSLSLFAKLKETFVDEGSPVKFEWQYFSAAGSKNLGEKEGEWKELQVRDGTGGLAKSGILEFSVPGGMKALQLYGSKIPLYWIRLLFTKGKRTPQISGLYPNCVWALQARTIEDEIFGSSLKKEGQVFELMKRPVVDAEVWVNEVSWLPEGEKQFLLKNKARDVKVTKDNRGRFSEFWVKWEEVIDFSGSDGRSRHYRLDRTSGKISFGNGTKGMIPPIGINNLRSSYRTGGGETGNLEAFSISKLYSALKYIDRVYNPAASEGGSWTEGIEELVERAPATFKHRNQAVCREDFTYLTKEASEKVGKVKVLSGLDEEGNSVPGLITVVIVPDSPGQKPGPTGEIVQIVEAYLKERAPNVGKLKVVGPLYYQVNVRALLVTTDPEAISEVESRVKTRIEEFLHPLKGGKKGNGWDFGQIPSTSDFYLLLSDMKGVRYVKEIEITFKAENGMLEKLLRPSKIRSIPESALPCSGKHEINVFWKAEREE